MLQVEADMGASLFSYCLFEESKREGAFENRDPVVKIIAHWEGARGGLRERFAKTFFWIL